MLERVNIAGTAFLEDGMDEFDCRRGPLPGLGLCQVRVAFLPQNLSISGLTLVPWTTIESITTTMVI